MPLPANPSNGQTALLNGISYVYDGAKGTWRRQATSITVSDFVVQGNLTLASNVESTSSSTGALVISGGLGVSGSVFSGGIYTNSLFYSNGSPYTVGGAGGASASSVPKITNIQVTDSSYVVLDDTAVDTAGGYIKITGTDFVSGCTVLIGSTPASSVTFVSSTEVRAQVPATSAGTYVVYLVNPDGGVAIRVNGITFSGSPSWVTGTTLDSGVVDFEINIQLNASGASTYALAAGSTLPSGLTLSNVGLLSGTVTGLENDTTYNFTVVATDAELQDSPRAFSITINVNDEFFPYVSLLLDGEGTDGSQNNTFIDSSGNNFAITRNGNTTQGSFSPYGANWSAYFDGSGDVLTAPSNVAFSFGTGDFTVEFWVYYPPVANTNGKMVVDSRPKGTNGAYWIMGISNDGRMRFNSAVSGGTTVTDTVARTNQWVHYAATRSGTSLRLFANGQLVASATDSTGIQSSGISIGRNAFWEVAGDTWWLGYISNLRIVKGTALYTANFTPSRTPLTTVSGTSLLTCQSNRFIDNSTNNFTITKSGDVTVLNFSPFAKSQEYSATNNGGSGFFDGTGDFLTSASTTTNLLAFNGNFTVELWAYALTSSTIMSINPVSSSGTLPAVVITSTRIVVQSSYAASNAIDITGLADVTNTWAHYVFVRSGSTLTVYRNGISVGSTTFTTNYTATCQIRIANDTSNSPAGSFNGYVSNLKITPGTALYTANFVPPTVPLTAISGTSLLLNFTNAGVVDRSQQNVIETVGNAGISTAVKKYGSSSMYFDGNGDWLFLPASPNISLGNGDFTFECWIYATVASDSPIYECRSTNSNTDGFTVTAFSSTVIRVYTNAVLVSATISDYTNTWVHVAYTRSGSTNRLFINGILQSTATASDNFTNQIAVVGGGRYTSSSITNSFTGYIDDLRITRGYARYTANFTPPTGPHRLK